jgi:hypothetical protein
MKFIQRIQTNEYVNELLESRYIKNNSGLVGRLIKNNNWNPNINVVQLNACIDGKIKELEIQRIDNYNSNNESIEIKKILGLKNHFLKIFNLNCMLHYTSYGTTAESNKEAIVNMNTYTITQTQVQLGTNN